MPIANIVMLVVGTALACAYIMVGFGTAKRYDRLVAGLDYREHFFRGVYSVGFFLLDLFKAKLDSKVARERRRQISVINGELYAEYFLRLNYAQKISVGLFFVPFGFLFYPVMGSPLSVLLGFGAFGLAWWYYDMQITDEMEKRQDEIRRDLSDVISKLALLVNAGMILMEAWDRVSLTGESTLYVEMRNTVMDMRNSGKSEAAAILDFGARCMDQDIKKFSSTLVQNISKGNAELVSFLRQQSDASWTQRREYARQKGEEASSKLMLPIAGMMIGVMVMIVVPIFGSMGM